MTVPLDHWNAGTGHRCDTLRPSCRPGCRSPQTRRCRAAPQPQPRSHQSPPRVTRVRTQSGVETETEITQNHLSLLVRSWNTLKRREGGKCKINGHIRFRISISVISDITNHLDNQSIISDRITITSHDHIHMSHLSLFYTLISQIHKQKHGLAEAGMFKS